MSKQQLDARPSIAQRGLGNMREYGYAMIEACIKQDAGPQSEIDNLVAGSNVSKMAFTVP